MTTNSFATDHAEWVAYCYACDAENLEPHTFHMWQIHGRPTGPLG